MKISYNWIQEYVDFKLPPANELAERIGSQLGAVEEIVDLGKKYQGIVIARIVTCRPIEDSDHLNLCLIDDGGAAGEVERDESGHVQVVCAAPNVRDGLTVAWLPPGSTVPSSYDKDPFVLGSRQLRGYTSNGMLASPQELALSDSHDGILEIDSDVAPGTDFASHFKLNDFIIDIENKMFTHRPDCFGILGVAREIAGIYGRKFQEPDWYAGMVSDLSPRSENLKLSVRNEAAESVPRFMVIALSNIEIKASPLHYQTLLSRIGIRSINNIVDATNYFMYLTGQPLHAYDYDKVRALDGGDGATLVARLAHAGDKLTLLSGKQIEPREGAVLIATESQAIGLGGVMGGSTTEVDAGTKNIILECATFDMYSIRRTSMVHGIFSEAVTRFNKGQSPQQNQPIIIAAAKFICDVSGAAFASDLFDDNKVDQTVNPNLSIDTDFINKRLGLELKAEEIGQLLANVGFIVSQQPANQLEVQAPFWRTDIEIREDLVEEVGRLHGFDSIPLQLSERSLAPAMKNPLLELKADIRQTLSRAGANEVLTYSFVHGNLLDKVGHDRNLAYSLTNALSPDLQYYRQSLTPSLLDKVNPNIRAGYDRFAIFEIGKAHINNQILSDGAPEEYERLALVFAADSKSAKQYSGAAFYQTREYLDIVLSAAGLSEGFSLEPLESDDPETSANPDTVLYDIGRAAKIMLGEHQLGSIGEYKQSVRKALKLPEFCAGFELDLSLLLENRSKTIKYQPLPKFPKTGQDICLKVAAGTDYQSVFKLVKAAADEAYSEHAVVTVSPVDIFQRDQAADFKQITLRVSIASYQRTLTDTEVSKLMDEIASRAATTLNAERI